VTAAGCVVEGESLSQTRLPNSPEPTGCRRNMIIDITRLNTRFKNNIHSPYNLD
jgi:hypothetical protein